MSDDDADGVVEDGDGVDDIELSIEEEMSDDDADADGVVEDCDGVDDTELSIEEMTDDDADGVIEDGDGVDDTELSIEDDALVLDRLCADELTDVEELEAELVDSGAELVEELTGVEELVEEEITVEEIEAELVEETSVDELEDDRLCEDDCDREELLLDLAVEVEDLVVAEVLDELTVLHFPKPFWQVLASQ
ncbi:uncharacterized protein K460DRAFT_409927 [Cucurbitaria berberidis CBS 394.84]|uniref:Uncharacterized protein n=1 Tax=Cucurbitaria berberidis CBS 394.84 TaxID=1168544 RepID=A0A9P4GBH0_9PLEO|nr:uncharacterized protein K460DRAFT_409927 [Cucurbitaria berberidis CBS 394.84]KAF1842520.1 hypothetical protein K460DRAFT_409927 [Cucurbitaria berberidis CBS 394.84]